MNKVLLIIQREYLSRVRKKAFLITVFLVPALLLGMYAVMYLLYKNSSEMNTVHVVKVLDDSGVFASKLHDKTSLKFKSLNEPLTSAKKGLKKNQDEIILLIPKNYEPYKYSPKISLVYQPPTK
jgi:ABC-2 type transport system permease protein